MPVLQSSRQVKVKIKILFNAFVVCFCNQKINLYMSSLQINEYFAEKMENWVLTEFEWPSFLLGICLLRRVYFVTS